MVIKGTVTQSLTPGVSWSPRGGRLEEARVQILHTDLAAYETTAQAAGYEYRYEPIGSSPMGVFSYKRPQASQIDEDLSDTWAVRYITEQRDIWLDDLVVAQMATIATADARARFKGDIDAMLRGERSRPEEYDSAGTMTRDSYYLTTADIIEQAGKTGDPAFTAMTNALVDDLSNGVTSQFVSTPALVRSSVRPASTSLQPVFSYINNLCTTAGLLAYETTIPSNLAAALTGTLSAYYWLMQAPTMEQQEDGRWRYQREYWGVPRIANLLTDRIVTPT